MGKKLKKKVPELRFPEFHGNWITDRIDHFLVRYVNSVDVELDTEYKQIGIRSHGKGIFHKDPVTGKELGNKRVFWVHPDAFTVNIVFAWEQAVALTSSEEEGYIASHRFLMFLPKQNRADLKFVLLFFLRKRGKHLLELASPGGAGRNKTLGQENFAELEVTFPQREEQEKIASFLGAIATRLTQLRRKHELLQTYKRGVMQKIFSQQIRFKRDDGKPFPEWKEKKLKDICSLIKDGTHGTHQDDPSSEYLLLSAKNIINGKVIYDDSDRKISQPEFCSIYKNYQLQKNDLLLSIVGTIGRTAIFQGESNLAFQRSVAFFRLKDSLSPNFIFHQMNNIKFQRELMKRQVLSAQAGIYLGDLAKIYLCIPSITEQEKIANFLTAIDRKIEAIAQQIDLTEQFKKGLLQKMFV